MIKLRLASGSERPSGRTRKRQALEELPVAASWNALVAEWRGCGWWA